MLEIFRKAKKSYTVLITVMLLLPVQQTFAQDSTMLAFENNSSAVDSNGSMDMTSMNMMDMAHCKSSKNGKSNLNAQDTVQQNNCCDENICDSNHCSSAASFVAIILNYDLINAYISQQVVFYVEQREITILPSQLFRPPRIIQS